MPRYILLVGLGGGIGSIFRFLCQKYIYEWQPHPFPLGTFLVNIGGCFLIGLFQGIADKGNILSPEWRLFFTAGFCGGFTTFSTFAAENLEMLKNGNFLYFSLYTSGSVIFGIAAAMCGIALVKLI